MIERLVFQSRKDAKGRIVALGHRGQRWSPRAVDEVIADIRSGRHRYVIPWEQGRALVVVVEDSGSSRLDAPTPDGTPGGLQELPNL